MFQRDAIMTKYCIDLGRVSTHSFGNCVGLGWDMLVRTHRASNAGKRGVASKALRSPFTTFSCVTPGANGMLKWQNTDLIGKGAKVKPYGSNSTQI
jgi:hypothetical protein